MADLEEITETPRTDIDGDSNRDEEIDLADCGPKRKSSKKRRNSKGKQNPAQTSQSNLVFEESRRDYRQPTDSPKQEDHRALFYEDYRKVSAEYDKGFLKKHDEDLNTTLIFAGLFSAVTSAFIIEVDPQLQSDPGDETAALLRVLIYKIDNTTFGNNVPTLPQWTGPPRAMVQVQAILFASLTISLFSAFLAMLGKQWLNRYESTDIRGSAIERSHHRQRKLGGVVSWYFDYVMESLPLMLQAALLLLGCALSRYLWEINTTVASVVIGVTSFGVTFYLFIVIAGTASESCPYQTPAAHIFRHILHYLFHHILPALHYLFQHILPALRSALSATLGVVSSSSSRISRASTCCDMFYVWRSTVERPWYSMINFIITPLMLAFLPITVVIDSYNLGRTIFRLLVALCKTSFHQLVGGLRGTRRWFNSISLRTPGLDQQTITLDLQCISWILRISLDKTIQLIALKFLTSMPEFAHFHPILSVDCFNIFTRCIDTSNGKVAVMPGLDRLATVSAGAFFRTLHHLASTDPTSSALANIQRRYNEVFPSDPDFTSLPFDSTMTKIHTLACQFGGPRDIRWNNHGMSIQEHVPFARRMVEAAQEGFQQTNHEKVPRSILRFALYSLSLGPLAPTSLVADCLTIVAIDLGCDIPSPVDSDESVRTERISNLIVRKLKTMVQTADPDSILSKRKAISTLFPHAIFLEQGGQQEMVETILRAARISDSEASNLGKFMWHHVVLYISRLFEKRSPTPLNRIIALISPFVPWEGLLNNPIAVSRWAAAALAIPYTEEVGTNVVDALFQIAYVGRLRPHIPIEIWGWLKRQPSLPQFYHGKWDGRNMANAAYLRKFGDIDLLKSYFLVVWKYKAFLPTKFAHEMERSIRENFFEIGMEHHRRDLIKQLDRVLVRFDQDEDTPYSEASYRKASHRKALSVKESYRKESYRKASYSKAPYSNAPYERLRDVLLEADKQ